MAGRQSSGYYKLLLLKGSFPIFFDLYLLKFPTGSSIKPHIDKAKFGYNHYRLNIVLKRPKEGGIFHSENTILNTDRIKFFRPDIYTHHLTEIKSGTRLILSFGFLTKQK